MSIWNIIFKQSEEKSWKLESDCAPPVQRTREEFIDSRPFEAADASSVRPFAATMVAGVRTFRGVKHGAHKPSGLYSLVDPNAVARNRERSAELFKLYLAADAAFDLTFSKDPWPEPAVCNQAI